MYLQYIKSNKTLYTITNKYVYPNLFVFTETLIINYSYPVSIFFKNAKSITNDSHYKILASFYFFIEH